MGREGDPGRIQSPWERGHSPSLAGGASLTPWPQWVTLSHVNNCTYLSPTAVPSRCSPHPSVLHGGKPT